MSLLGGKLCEVAHDYMYQSPTPPPPLFFNLFYSNQHGVGNMGPCAPLAMPVTVLLPGFVNMGAKAREPNDKAGGGGVVGGVPPLASHIREIFDILCIKIVFLHII